VKRQLENILNHKVNNQVSNSSLQLKTTGFSCSKNYKTNNAAINNTLPRNTDGVPIRNYNLTSNDIIDELFKLYTPTNYELLREDLQVTMYTDPQYPVTLIGVIVINGAISGYLHDIDNTNTDY